jgi:transposase-like protein
MTETRKLAAILVADVVQSHLRATNSLLRSFDTPSGSISFRDVEDLLAERGLDVSYETVRRWVLKFGPQFTRALLHRYPRPTPRWHLDEMAVIIAGKQFWLWRAIDDEGEVLDLLVQRRRDQAAACRFPPRFDPGFPLRTDPT